MILTDAEKKLLYWQLAVEGIDVFKLPDASYEAASKENQYERFTSFVREYAERVINRRKTGVDLFEFGDSFPAVKGSTDGDWWKQATRLGGGKFTKNNLPTVDSPKKPPKKKDNKAIMDAFLPAYRAIKDSFDKRPFWHWFTQHDRYVMERDTIKALKGLMISLTQQTSVYVDDMLKAYRKDDKMWLQALDRKDRKNILDAVRQDNSLSIEDAVKAALKEDIHVRLQDDIANDFANEKENRYAAAMNTNEEQLTDDELDFNPEQIDASQENEVFDLDDIGEFGDMLKAAEEGDVIIDGDEAKKSRIELPELAELVDGGEVSNSIKEISAPIPQNIK